ncbi:probable purple acid phosphatase 20 [Benincasa hispida]|uniref:probable purple acid phosphatase 20 n=1 Tax=Benincasa hispida TaxID=102211 RepID=UPI0018FFB884|nr:probable purple acid phosphatase 20 [Benincasa hispida]
MPSFPAAFTIAVAAFASLFSAVSAYQRPPPRRNLFVPRRQDLDYDSPEQVHISLVGVDKMRITWITEDSAPSVVEYSTSPGVYTNVVTGITSSYKYALYESGNIHDVTIGPLNPDTTYYYRCSSNSARNFTLKTPPAQLPIKFVVIGDLGQTEWTKTTLKNVAKSDYDVLLLPGDLSYADFVQSLWDSFGRLVEPLASQRPWMVTQGNHEVERIPVIHSNPFTAYNARWHMPFEQSSSNSNLYYSFDTAGVHAIMLGSYIDFDTSSAQYEWLVADLKKINRSTTPWIVVLLHAPWYNSNTAHQGEKESVDMKAAMEDLLYQARVDVVFAGHVHAYERFTRVYNGEANNCAPIYITIGDGGNREGLASKYIDPKPTISLFRQASFGHGRFEVVNTTHALWTWHRNDDDDVAVIGDSFWFTSLSSDPACRI